VGPGFSDVERGRCRNGAEHPNSRRGRESFGTWRNQDGLKVPMPGTKEAGRASAPDLSGSRAGARKSAGRCPGSQSDTRSKHARAVPLDSHQSIRVPGARRLPRNHAFRRWMRTRKMSGTSDRRYQGRPGMGREEREAVASRRINTRSQGGEWYKFALHVSVAKGTEVRARGAS